MTEKKKINWLIFSIIIFLAFLLRFSDLGRKCFYSDETFTYGVCLGERYDNTTPSLFYNLSKPFLALPFDIEVNCRILPALFGLILVIVMFFIAKEFKNDHFPYMVAGMTAFNPILIQVSQEFRAYSMVTLLVALNLFAVLGLLKIILERKGLEIKLHYGWILLFIISGILGFYTHYLIIPYMFFVSIILLFAVLINRKAVKNLIAFIIFYIVFIVAILPGLKEFIFKSVNFTIPSDRGFFHIFTLRGLIKSLWGFIIGYEFEFNWISNAFFAQGHFDRWILLLFTTLLLVLFGSSIYKLFKRDGVKRFVASLWLLMLLIYPFTMLSAYRQMSPLLLLFIIILSLGIEGLTLRWRWSATLILTVVTALSLLWYYKLPYSPLHRADWRAAGKYLETNVKSGEVVFAVCTDLYLLSFDFYYRGEIVPVDEEACLYHTSRDHLKREERSREKGLKYYAKKVAEVLQQYDVVYVVVSLPKDDVTPLATDKLPISIASFGPRLDIKKFVRND
jgi:hypothetical protein